MQIRLFGGVSATTDDGTPVDVGPTKCQIVLAALALSPGSAVPVSRLAAMVWGEDPPRTADKTLQSYVTRLRKGLGPDSIVRVGAAYRLDINAESVDVARFQRHLVSGDLDAALEEWTGIPLAGVDAAGLTGVVDGLVEQWLSALETDLDSRIERDPRTAIGRLTELTASYPFSEGLWALLMTALYRVGRQADALAAYRRARQQLVDQLGVEPGPRLQELERMILDHDERLRVDRSSNRSLAAIPTGTVTFGFTDVADATRLWSNHRRETADAMVRHEELIRSAVANHNGYIFAEGSESFGVAFHRASDAVAWAAGLQASMDAEQWPDGLEMQLRVALHTGEAEERRNSYFGAAVNTAARIAAAGHGAQTLLSGVTAALLGDHDLRDLGAFRLDGLVAEQRIFQLGVREYPALRIENHWRGNLPRRQNRLIGRLDDLNVVDEALAASPVVTLIGPGGIGKTRLALAAASRVEIGTSDGAWLIELAGVAKSSDVPRAVADALNIVDTQGRSLTQSIETAIQTRQAVLVLDNCEHVIDGAADLARTLAERCPNVRILATSREGLGLADEQLLVVGPLDPASSGIELFNERASAASWSYDPQTSRHEVEEICRRLDGVPLAIELAAARTKSLSTTDIIERLDDRLRLLGGGRGSRVARHRTLRATIQWSYDLLEPAEQVLFQRLSIFAGTFDLTAAETVAADSAFDATDVDELLGGLVDRSMLIVGSGPFGRQFHILETMRQFGAEHLAKNGQTDLIAQRHARWCIDKVDHIRGLLAGQDEIEGVARLSELWGNLRAAVDWACDGNDPQMAHSLVQPIVAEIYLRSQSEIGDWVEQILAMTPPEDEGIIAFGITWAARRYMRNMDPDGYERLVEAYGEPDRAVIHFARAFVYGDHEGLAKWARLAMVELRSQSDDYMVGLFEIAGLGVTLLRTGCFEEHDALVAELEARFRLQGPPTCLNLALSLLGTSASLQGKHDLAWQFYEASAAVDVPTRTNSMNNPLEARIALRYGRRSEALGILRVYVAELLDNNNMYQAEFAGVEFVNMMVESGHLAEAGQVLDYLEATSLLDAPLFTGLVADSAAKIASSPTHAGVDSASETFDDREALAYMLGALDAAAAVASQQRFAMPMTQNP